jgi:hypothetical protein
MKISNARCNIGISDPCNVPSISHICEVWIQPKTDAGAKTTRASPTAPLPLPLQFGSCSSYPFFPATRPSLCQSNRAPQANVSPAYQHHESHLIWIDGGWLRCLLAPDGLRLGPNVPDLPRPSRPSTGGRDATAWCSPPGTPSHATAVWSQSSSTASHVAWRIRAGNFSPGHPSSPTPREVFDNLPKKYFCFIFFGKVEYRCRKKLEVLIKIVD